MSLSPKKKQKREKYKTCSLNEKLQIIEMKDNGASWAKIAREKGLNPSTIRSIYAMKDQIQSQGMY